MHLNNMGFPCLISERKNDGDYDELIAGLKEKFAQVSATHKAADKAWAEGN